MADFDAVNNFAKGEENASGDKTNLEQARNAIDDANKYLKTIVSLLTGEDSS